MLGRTVTLYQIAPLALLGQWLAPVVGLFFAWGWILVVMVLLWIIWKLYLFLKMIDYVSSIQWTYLQITIPEDSEQTPKAMENLYDVLDGIHKNPDLIELYFDGYLEAWYSCELHCVRGRVRYIMVVPTVHRTFFEGVIYGQYPSAELAEVEDYTQRYNYKEIEKTFDVYGTEVIMIDEDYLPIRTYREYEDVFSEEDKFVDPHQAMVESYTSLQPEEEFWVQVLVRPIAGSDIKKWALKGEAEIDKLAGKETKKELGLLGQGFQNAVSLPAVMLRAAIEGPAGAARSSSDRLDFPKVSAADTAKMDGILRKISRGGFRVKIRVCYLAPMGKLTKPNIARMIGGFKQFSSYHLNQFIPDGKTKTNGPDYFFKYKRRSRRKRYVLLFYQWRDFWGYEAGQMMSPEELATIYHFPTKFMRAPAVERAKAGVGGAPENVPYVE